MNRVESIKNNGSTVTEVKMGIFEVIKIVKEKGYKYTALDDFMNINFFEESLNENKYSFCESFLNATYYYLAENNGTLLALDEEGETAAVFYINK